MLYLYKSKFNLIIPRVNDLGTSLFYLHTNTSFNCLKYHARIFCEVLIFLETHKSGEKQEQSNSLNFVFFQLSNKGFLIPFLPHFQKFRLQNTSYGRSERLIDCIKSALKTKQQKRNYLSVPSDQCNNKIWFTYRFLS